MADKDDVKEGKNARLVDFTFPDSKIKIKIRKISPFLAREIQKDFPPPDPPQQEVDYGDGVVKTEANESHPDHVKKMREYNDEVETRMQNLILLRGVVFEITPEMQDEIDDVRQFLLETYKIESEESDKMIYLKYVAVGSDRDLRELINAVIGISQPTEEAIGRNVKSFRR